MRTLRRAAWAAVVAAATATPGLAQQSTTTIGGFNGSTTAGTSSGTGAGGGTASGNAGSGNGTGMGQTTLPTAPVISAPTGTTTSRVISASNPFGPYLANPYYQGTMLNSRAGAAPGGFGVPLFGTTTTAGGNLGSAGGAAGTGGAAGAGGAGGLGGLGGAGGRAGGAGSVNTVDPGGVLVQLPRQIAYTAQVKFPVIPAGTVQLQNDLRGFIDRAPTIANPAGVQVQVTGTAVVLRGAVRDEEEARLVEGLVRLTPGVGVITNELAYPRP